MATLVFAILIAASLILAFASKRGHKVDDLREFFIASRQFGSFLLFFLAAREIYSIGTMIGFPGGASGIKLMRNRFPNHRRRTIRITKPFPAIPMKASS